MLSSINNFGPFEADVWGTVSDWAMVLVTAITAIFIYKTFQSQLIVTRSQLKLQDIESDRFRKEIMPRFTLSTGKKAYTFPALPSNFFIQDLLFELNNNPLDDIAMKITECVGYELYNGNGDEVNLPKSMNAKWSFTLQFKYESRDGGTLPMRTPGQCHIVFELTFKDVRLNSYQQILVFVPELTQQCYTNEPLLIQATE